MFPLRFDFGRHDAAIAIRCVVGRHFGAYAVSLDGLRADSRFIPPMPALRERWQVVSIALRGELRLGARTLDSRELLVTTARNLMADSAEVPVSLSRGGALVALRLLPSVIDAGERGARITALGSEAGSALRRLAADVEAGAVEAARRSAASVVRALVADGEATPDAALVEPRERTFVERMVEVTFPIVAQLAAKPMLIDVVERTGLSERQILRNFSRLQAEYDLLDRGWRQSIVRWRTMVAGLFLSAHGLSIDDVASIAGYSSTTAMGRALRDAGLPTAAAIRASFAAAN